MKNMQEQHKEMEDILKAELDREAREILAEIEADESLQNLTMPDDAEEELMRRIQKLEEERAVYERLSEKDKEALRLGRELQMQKENKIADDSNDSDDADRKVVTFRKKKRRTYLLVAVVAVFVMMMGMSAVGEVPLVTELKGQVFGDRELTNVNSERENENLVEDTEDEDVKVYKEIKDAFSVDIIRLDYMPDKTEIIDYDIDEILNWATIMYEYEGTILEYRMIFNYREQSYGYMTEDELISEETIMANDIFVRLQEYQIESEDEKMYMAQFVYQDVQYIFNATTTLSQEEMEKILKNIKKF